MANEEAKVHECDVLIIGGGLAGTYAAIKAKEFTDDIIIVDKAKIGKTGCSTFAAGVMLAPQPEDDLDVWTAEIAKKGNYLGDQEWTQVMLKEQIENIDDLQSWGVEFEKDSEGKLVRVVGRGHEDTRMLMFHGPQFMKVMKGQIAKRNINLVERVMITELLTSDGQHPTSGSVVGAIGFNIRDGQFQIFKAKSVIIANGGVYGNYWGARNCTGDGIAMGYRVGAELYGMEFAMPVDGWVFGRKYKCNQGLNMWVSNGAYLVNSKGERYMEKYEPVIKERARLAELILGLAKECAEGRGPVYMDMRHFSPEIWERFRRVIPYYMRIANIIEPWNQKVQYDFGAGAINAMTSGILNNLYCETNIPGLYVAGQASGFMPHGTYAVGGICLAMCTVGGRRAGRYAASYSKLSPEVEINESQLESLKNSSYAPMYVKDGIVPDEMFARIRQVAAVPYALFRNETKLNTLLSDLKEVTKLASQVSADDSHVLARANEVQNFLQCLSLIYAAALARKETRGSHSRADYPYRDDVNWLKRVVLRSEGDDRVGIRFEPIPIYRYRFKPAKLEKVVPLVPPVNIE
ncbi:FAD-binding protein [Chloroflexota bacterium]